MCWGQGGPGAKCDENEYKWIRAQTGMQLVQSTKTQILSKVKKQLYIFWNESDLFCVVKNAIAYLVVDTQY